MAVDQRRLAKEIALRSHAPEYAHRAGAPGTKRGGDANGGTR